MVRIWTIKVDLGGIVGTMRMTEVVSENVSGSVSVVTKIRRGLIGDTVMKRNSR